MRFPSPLEGRAGADLRRLGRRGPFPVRDGTALLQGAAVFYIGRVGNAMSAKPLPIAGRPIRLKALHCNGLLISGSTPNQNDAADEQRYPDQTWRVDWAFGKAQPSEVIEGYRCEHLACNKEGNEGCRSKLRH